MLSPKTSAAPILVVALFLMGIATYPSHGAPPKKKTKHKKNPAVAPLPPSATNTGTNTGAAAQKLLPPRPTSTTDGGENGDSTASGSGPGSRAGRDALLSGAGAAAVATARPGRCDASLEQFLRVPQLSALETGPEDELFLLNNATGVAQLYTTKSLVSAPSLLAELPEGIRNYHATKDAQKFLLATDVGGDEQYDLHLFDRKTKAVTPVWVDRKVRIESFRWSPDGNFALLTANGRSAADMDLYRWAPGDEKPTAVAELSGMHLIVDVDASGKHALLEEVRSNFDSQLVLWNVAEKRRMLLPASPPETRNEGALFAARDAFWFLSDRASDYLVLYRQPLSGGAPQRLLAEKGDVESIATNADRTVLAASLNIDGVSQLRLFAVTPDGKIKKALPTPGGSPLVTTSLAVGAPLGGTLFAIASAPRVPPTVFRWQRGERTQLRGEPPLDPDACLTSARLVRYPTFDGLQVPAIVYEPAGKKPARFLLLLHGGPESQTRPEFSRTVQYIVSRGYGVMAPNFRGSTGYGKAFAALDNGHKRMDAVQDVVFAAHWLIREKLSTEARIALYGGSYGGFLVLRTMQVEPKLFGAGAEAVGIVDFVEFLKGTKSYRRALREREYGALSDTVFLRSISPITYVDRFEAPLLLFHGSRDPRVPVEETERLGAALERAGKKFEMKIFRDSGHGHAKVESLIEQTKLLMEFLDKNLPAEK